ncbi:DUF2162 family putative transporter [Methanopyrus sp.]
MLRYHPMTVSDALAYGLVYGLAAPALAAGTGALLDRIFRVGRPAELARSVSEGFALSGAILPSGLVHPVMGAVAASLTALLASGYLISRRVGMPLSRGIVGVATAAAVVFAALTSWMAVPFFADNPIYALAVAFFVFIVGLKTGLGIGFAGFGLRRSVLIALLLSAILVPAILGLGWLTTRFLSAALETQRYALLGHAVLGLVLMAIGAFIARKWHVERSSEEVSRLGVFVVAVPCPICLIGVALSVALYARIGSLSLSQSALVLWACYTSTTLASLVSAEALIRAFRVPPAVALSGLENAVGLLFVLTGLIAWLYPLWKKAPKVRIPTPPAHELCPVLAALLGLAVLGYGWAMRRERMGEYPPSNPVDDALRVVIRWLASRR